MATFIHRNKVIYLGITLGPYKQEKSKTHTKIYTLLANRKKLKTINTNRGAKIQQIFKTYTDFKSNIVNAP